MKKIKYGPENPEETYISHHYEEHLFDIGEIQINYATVGSSDNPTVVLIPGQTESWWGYEKAMGILSEEFQVFAVDLRGQGRSGRTPGRYTWDNFGNDMVKFIALRIKKSVIVSGLSSGGVIAAWLSAYAPPGMILGAHYEDPPLFSSEIAPAMGPAIREGAGSALEMYSTYLGDQWRVGDWQGMMKNVGDFLPAHMRIAFLERNANFKDEPPQNIKEYDPEWAKACYTGSIGASCDHEKMLKNVKCPVLYTYHDSMINPKTGDRRGACSSGQLDLIEKIIKDAGQPFTRLSFPKIGHAMHLEDPELFAKTFSDWAKDLLKNGKGESGHANQ